MNDKMKAPSNFDHVIDWDKVKKIEDVVEILKGLGMKYDINKANPKLKKLLTPIETLVKLK
jgi:hypothetical protein